jgi:hypothetical protein
MMSGLTDKRGQWLTREENREGSCRTVFGGLSFSRD